MTSDGVVIQDIKNRSTMIGLTDYSLKKQSTMSNDEKSPKKSMAIDHSIRATFIRSSTISQDETVDLNQTSGFLAPKPTNMSRKHLMDSVRSSIKKPHMAINGSEYDDEVYSVSRYGGRTSTINEDELFKDISISGPGVPLEKYKFEKAKKKR